MLRFLSTVALLVIEVVCAGLLLNQFGSAISSASTAAAMVGFFGASLTIVFGVFFAWKLLKSLYQQVSRFRGVSRGPATLPMLFLLVFGGMALSSCYTTVSPGHVGISVHNYGTDRGVSSYTLQTGVVWYVPGVVRVFEYPTFVQTVKWTASPNEGSSLNEEFVFNSKDAVVVTADVSLSYQLVAEKVPHFYVKFRSDDLEDFTNGYLHNIARDAFQEEAPNYTALELYGEKKDVFLKAVRDRIASQVDSIGVSISQFGLLGNLGLPPQITDAVNAKVAATQNAQRAQNQIIQAQAEAQQAIAKATGESQANLLLTRSLTPELIQWRSLDIQQQAMLKWNGVLPTFSGGGAIPLIQLPQPK